MSDDVVLQPDDSYIAVFDPNKADSAFAIALAEALKKAQTVKEDEDGEECRQHSS